jgi:hypothetical protein
MPPNMDNGRLASSATPGYETRDVNTGAVLGFLIFLSLVIGLVTLGNRLLFRFYSASEQQPAPASSFFNVRQVPAEPDLQVDPRSDLLKAYAKQQQALETYAWEDRRNGTVRIPIERAMDLLLTKGTPVISEKVPEERQAGKHPAGQEAK